MKILITGAKGFIGKNLIAQLRNQGFTHLFEYDLDFNPAELDRYACECEFVFHLAGVNRPDRQEEFMTGNPGFTSLLLDTLKKHHNHAPVLITSSTQATLDNPYGRSKQASEELMFHYSRETGNQVFVYRLPNVFGKWCRPEYNSAVATFCHNIANDLPVKINDPNVDMNLIYIDDVVKSFIEKARITQQCSALANYELPENNCFETVSPVHTIKLGEIVALLVQFRESRNNLQAPNISDDFAKKLYSTYLSYLPTDKFSYPLKMNSDRRGSFTEFLKTADSGQVSINISKPHTTKGNHWHHTKNEKFLVVSGVGVIRLRRIDSNKVIEYFVSGEKLEVIDIPVGYTHNIENLGDTDMVTVMWVNEIFDKEKPDTFSLGV